MGEEALPKELQQNVDGEVKSRVKEQDPTLRVCVVLEPLVVQEQVPVLDIRGRLCGYF